MPAMTPLRPIARRALAAQSDERLLRLAREGHDPAFEEIVRRYRGPLVAFAAAIVASDRAEDVVQAALTKAHRALLSDAREIALRPWLFAIVRNGALNAIRDEPRTDELDPFEPRLGSAPAPSQIAEQRDDLERLVVAICALPTAQRQALVKRELEGIGHGEIAAQLGTSATAVRGLIFRARTSLRDAVGAAVPYPVLRFLLTEAPAAGLAGGGAALLGGTGAKAITAVTAAVMALGTGIAIEGDGGEPNLELGASAGPGPERIIGADGVDRAGARQPSAPLQAERNEGGGSGGASSGSRGPAGDDRSGGEAGDERGSSDGDVGGSSGPSAPSGDGIGGDGDSGGGSPDDGEHSGPGDGSLPPPDDGSSSSPGASPDGGGFDSSGSGSGDSDGGGFDSSGTGSGTPDGGSGDLDLSPPDGEGSGPGG